MLYEQGNVEPLEIVFGAKSLDEALSSIDNLSRASGQSEDVLRQLKAARAQLAAASQQLAGRQRRARRSATQQARRTAAALAQTRAARSAYIGSLASQRRLNDSPDRGARRPGAGRRRCARERSRRAAAAAARAASGSRRSRAPRVAAAACRPSRRAHDSRSRATGYALGGTTATGLPVGWGVVAVDPSVIPLGTHMTIPGYGEAVAADTGGAVVGATIDLWFPTIAQANAWGRRTVTIVLH